MPSMLSNVQQVPRSHLSDSLPAPVRFDLISDMLATIIWPDNRFFKIPATYSPYRHASKVRDKFRSGPQLFRSGPQRETYK